MTAKTEYADKFQDWVTSEVLPSEVLPSIRKTGTYNINNYNNENLDKYKDKDCKTKILKNFCFEIKR